MYNITQEVLEASKAKGFHGFGTGGGCDFVICEPDVSDGLGGMFVIGNNEHHECPDTLDEPAQLSFYTGENWAYGFAWDCQMTVGKFLESIPQAPEGKVQSEETFHFLWKTYIDKPFSWSFSW